MTEIEEKAVSKILQACKELGWELAIPTANVVDGMILGTAEYINRILADYEGTDYPEYNDD